ncbi:MAG TPA: phosphopyruvate hydratase [Candidatus Paceibacterota bacterium]
MRIDHVVARQILDTRWRPTIETTLHSGEFSATASVPSGKSTGEHEAVELDATSAIENVNGEIAAALVKQDFQSLDELDNFLIALDGTPNKARLGANAILSVSIAAMRLSALQDGTPLWKAVAKRAGTTPSAPWLFVNVMNGGVHSNFRLPFQEYILVIEDKTSAALPVAQQAFAKLGKMLGDGMPMGDEGGYAPTFNNLEKPFEILVELVKEFPDTFIAIDAAASQLFQDGAYIILGKRYSADELLRAYEDLVERFTIASIEDPFDEHATDDFIRFTAAADNRILVVGDDFTCTNPKLIADAIQKKAVNAILIKPNQIGTVMEAIEAVQETHAAGFKAVCSHRSGETNDTFIADFAYGIGAYGLKAGGLGQPERLAKYSRLLAIEREAESV